jgi:chemotaxis-related protein WspB
MLFLIFELGNDRYALDVRQIAAVLPLVEVRRMPWAPQPVAGLCTYGARWSRSSI